MHTGEEEETVVIMMQKLRTGGGYGSGIMPGGSEGAAEGETGNIRRYLGRDQCRNGQKSIWSSSDPIISKTRLRLVWI